MNVVSVGENKTIRFEFSDNAKKTFEDNGLETPRTALTSIGLGLLFDPHGCGPRKSIGPGAIITSDSTNDRIVVSGKGDDLLSLIGNITKKGYRVDLVGQNAKEGLTVRVKGEHNRLGKMFHGLVSRFTSGNGGGRNAGAIYRYLMGSGLPQMTMPYSRYIDNRHIQMMIGQCRQESNHALANNSAQPNDSIQRPAANADSLVKTPAEANNVILFELESSSKVKKDFNRLLETADQVALDCKVQSKKERALGFKSLVYKICRFYRSLSTTEKNNWDERMSLLCRCFRPHYKKEFFNYVTKNLACNKDLPSDWRKRAKTIFSGMIERTEDDEIMPDEKVGIGDVAGEKAVSTSPRSAKDLLVFIPNTGEILAGTRQYDKSYRSDLFAQLTEKGLRGVPTLSNVDGGVRTEDKNNCLFASFLGATYGIEYVTSDNVKLLREETLKVLTEMEDPDRCKEGSMAAKILKREVAGVKFKDVYCVDDKSGSDGIYTVRKMICDIKNGSWKSLDLLHVLVELTGKSVGVFASRKLDGRECVDVPVMFAPTGVNQDYDGNTKLPAILKYYNEGHFDFVVPSK